MYSNKITSSHTPGRVGNIRKTMVNMSHDRTAGRLGVRTSPQLHRLRPPRHRHLVPGYEEAGGGQANISTQLKFQPVMDNAEAHKMLGVTHLHWGKHKIQRTWRGICYIMLRLEGQEPTRENIRRYQAEILSEPRNYPK